MLKHKKAIIVTSTIVVLAIVTAIICHRNWRIWFYNYPEDPYKALNEPGRIMLTPGDITSNSRNVSWQCDSVVRESYLLLADEVTSDTSRIDAYGEVFESRSGRAAYYVARLRQLEAGHTYKYSVVTDGKQSEWHKFSMPNKSDECSFMFIGDMQDTLGGIVHSLVDSAIVRNGGIDMLVLGGDFTQYISDSYWAESMMDIDSIRQSTPVMNITGNHDYLKSLPAKLERRFSLVFSYFLDSEIGHSEGSAVAGSQVFTTTMGNVQFFCLDGNRELPYLYSQRSWLKEQLANSTARWKVVLIHQPIYSARNSKNNAFQRYVFEDLFNDSDIDLVLQGHEHAYARTYSSEGDMLTSPLYTISHCSPKHYNIEFKDNFHKFGCGDFYYQMVKTNGDTLKMATYRIANDNTFATSLYDSLVLVKDASDDRKRHVKINDLGRDIKEVVFTDDTIRNPKFNARIKDYKARHPERF